MIVTGATAVEAVRDLPPHRFAMWHVEVTDAHQLLGDPPEGVDSTSVRLIARSERNEDGHARIAEVYSQDGYWHVWVRDGDDSLGFIVNAGPSKNIDPNDLASVVTAGARFLAHGAERMLFAHGLGIDSKPEMPL